MKYNTILCFCLITIGLQSQKSSYKIITLEPYLSFQHYEHFKRLTLNSPDSGIEYLDNFDFQWGYQYKIEVTETTLKEELSDGTKYSYKLKKIVSKTKVADTFQFKLLLDGKRYYHTVDESEQAMNQTCKQINDSTFLYFDTVEIEVPASLKEKINSIIEGKTTHVGTFEFIDEKRIRLIHL